MNDYSLESTREYLLTHLDELLQSGVFRSAITERMSAEYDNHVFVDATGYDTFCPITEHKREVKATHYVQTGKNMRIGSFQGKKGLFDTIKIIDTNSNRTSVIPHDEFFEVVGDKGEFRWSASYNETDRVRVEHTQLFLKYEVK